MECTGPAKDAVTWIIPVCWHVDGIVAVIRRVVLAGINK